VTGALSTGRRLAGRTSVPLCPGVPGVLITVGGQPGMVMAFTVVDGTPTVIRTLRAPDRLAQVVPSWVA